MSAVASGALEGRSRQRPVSGEPLVPSHADTTRDHPQRTLVNGGIELWLSSAFRVSGS